MVSAPWSRIVRRGSAPRALRWSSVPTRRRRSRRVPHCRRPGRAAPWIPRCRLSPGTLVRQEPTMRTVNMHEAKTHLSRLVDAAAKGEPFIIARAGKPLVKVVPLDPPAASRRFGFMAGQFTVPDDFDRMFEDEIADMFEGKE